MTTLRLNTSGDGHAWGDLLTSKIAAVRGEEPSESLYVHALGRALDQLIGPYRNKPIVTALIEHLIAEASAVEVALWQVRDSRDIDLAKTDALLMLGRLIQAKLHSRFADSTLRAILDNHALATAGGAEWADLERWILTFFGVVVLTESTGAELRMAITDPTSVFDDIADWKLATYEGYVASSLTAPTVSAANYDTNLQAEAVFVGPEKRWVTTVRDSDARLYEMGVPGQIQSCILRGTVSLASLLLSADLRCVRYDVDGKWLFTCDARYVYKMPTVTPFSPIGISELAEVLDTNSDTGGVSLLGFDVAATGQAVYVTTGTTIYQYDLAVPHRFFDDFGVAVYSMAGTKAAATGAKGIQVHGSGSRYYENNIPGVASARIWMSTMGTDFDITTGVFAAATPHLMGISADIHVTHDEDMLWLTASAQAIPFTFSTPGSFPSVGYKFQDACSAWGVFAQATLNIAPTPGEDYVHVKGTNQYMASTDADLLAALNAPDFTLTFRATRTSTGSAKTLFSARESSTERFKVGFDSSDRFFVTRGASTFVVPDVVDTGAHAYTISVHEGECTIVVDGVEYTGEVGAATYALTDVQLFWNGTSEFFEGYLYNWAFFEGTANSLTDLNDWAWGKPWPALEYFIETLLPEVTAGVTTHLNVALGTGMFYSDALDPPETDSGTFFAIEET